MAPPEASGTLTINEGSGPFSYGATLTFTTETEHLRNGYPMVEVSLYQDVNEDGTTDTDLLGPEIVWGVLVPPEDPVQLGAGSSKLDTSKSAKGRARLLRYAWNGNKGQSIDELDSTEFDVSP